jgi:hypothetical protein
MNWNPDHVEAKIKLTIAVSFCITIVAMVFLSMYSLVFVTQPMSGIAPADKQFFFLLSDMSKYILGSLGTLLAIKGKDVFKDMVPPKDEPKEEKKEIV